MHLNRLILVIASAVLPFALAAQTAREEIAENPWLAGSNYVDYDRQLPDFHYTKAPRGYTPFYFSHYGRHGSRWLIADDSYERVLSSLRKARRAGVLTADGEKALRQIELFNKTTSKRLGDLTTVGERQHHGIGRRMAQHFPDLFVKTKGLPIDARSTTVNRCILSMVAECEELMAANPTAQIHNDVSDALQYYLNQPWDSLLKATAKQGDAEARRFISRNTHPERLTTQLFTDPRWAADSIDTKALMRQLFEVAINMQSHDDGPDMLSLFTTDELYDLWRTENARWYQNYGASPLTKGLMPFSQYNLLKNIIETADTCIASGRKQATLRFGHEVCVLPLACLMELDDCGTAIADLDKVDSLWRNYRIFPMACNVQMVFYKKKKGEGDVLVKVLLNEREARLPVTPTSTPYYYRWQDVRAYWQKKLNDYPNAAKH